MLDFESIDRGTPREFNRTFTEGPGENERVVTTISASQPVREAAA